MKEKLKIIKTTLSQTSKVLAVECRKTLYSFEFKFRKMKRRKELNFIL